jgi:ketol-acid reductoisomerase
VRKVKRCRDAPDAGEYVRRSLTVTPENDKKILLTKGRFLTGDEPFDIDYTTMVNIFIELGHKLMNAAWNDTANPNAVVDKNEIIESFKKHFFNDELKEEAVGDQVAEIIFRKLVEQTSLATSDQVQQNQTAALPAEQSQSANTKIQKYIR